MTVASAAIAQLVAEGVEVVFGIPGAHNILLCDAVLDYPQLRFIGGRHEQSPAFMANGYARASGKIAVPLVITGPGVTNSLTAMADAYQDSVPMVLIASCQKREMVGKGEFHGLKDQSGVLASVAKWSTRVERAEDVQEAIHSAFNQAYDGRPGPTAVEIPINLYAEETQSTVVPSSTSLRREADSEAVREAARQLNAARAPVVLAGGGAAQSDCAQVLIQLLEHTNAPCYLTPLGKGTVPDDHPLSSGLINLQIEGAPGRVLLEEADLLLVVGSSLDDKCTLQWTLPLPKNIIQIDICNEIIGQHYPVKTGLVGDAKAVLKQLLNELVTLEPVNRKSPVPRIAEMKEQVLAKSQHIPVWPYINALEEVLSPDAIVTNDASLVNGWILGALKRSLPRTVNITANLAALGYALPSAFGAKIAYPDRQVVAVMGDGGFLFTSEALATAVEEKLNVVTLVFNDNCYITIKRMQIKQCNRSIGVDLVNPDFVKLAQAYGAHGLRVQTPDQLHDALLSAFAQDLPSVIEIPLEIEPFPFDPS